MTTQIIVHLLPHEIDWFEWQAKQLKIGSGCNGLALLNDVPIWWETWRQINSFPANYYVPKEMNAKKSSKEKPNKEKSK